MDAKRPSDIARSGNNAAIAGPPNNDGLSPKVRAPKELDRRKERVHIYMQEAEGSVRRRTAERVGGVHGSSRSARNWDADTPWAA